MALNNFEWVDWEIDIERWGSVFDDEWALFSVGSLSAQRQSRSRVENQAEA